MPTLSSSIQALAEKFAAEILTAVRGMSLAEVLGETNTAMPQNGAVPRKRGRPAASANTAVKRGPGRPPKSSGRRGLTVETIVGVLKQHKGGLGTTALRKALGDVSRGQWRYAIEKAIAEKKIRMRGTKNTAMYFAT